MPTTPKSSSRPSTPQPRSTSLSTAPSPVNTTPPARAFTHAHAHPNAQSPTSHYHSAPLPPSPSHSTFASSSSVTSPTTQQARPATPNRSSTPTPSGLSRAMSASRMSSSTSPSLSYQQTGTSTPTSSISTITAATTAPTTPTQQSPRNSTSSNSNSNNNGSSYGINSSNNNNSSSSMNIINSSSTMTDGARTQFNTSLIERSFQALLKKQPVATPGPAVLHGKGHRHLHPKDTKPRHYLTPHSHHHHSSSHHQSGSDTSNSLSHSPIFGSPAADHARHWIKSVGHSHDHNHRGSDSENERLYHNSRLHRDASAESDDHDDSAEETQPQQWQIDYDHHVAGHVELESAEDLDSTSKTKEQQETQDNLQPPLSPSASSWTGNVHPMFSMADPMGNTDQGLYPGLITPAIARPTVRVKERMVHPLSPAPASPNSGGSTPRVSISRSPEIRPQLVVHPADLTTLLDLGSILPIAPSTVNQPLPPVPGGPPEGKATGRNKFNKQSGPTSHLKGSRPSVLTVETPAFKEKKPVSLTNPPRKCIHHGKILQVINTSTVKDRYLFLFSDLLLIAKPMSDGHPTIESRFQVKDVIELKKISLSLTRDKHDAKNGTNGASGGRKIPPALAEFIHTFDQNPTRALNAFIQKKALQPDPVSVAYLLFKTPELSKSQLALFLANPANRHVYRSFLDLFQFAGMPLDEAFRMLLGRLSLPERLASKQRAAGSSERTIDTVDYLLEEFTKRWYEANVNVVVFDASMAHKLIVAMLVLNAQLHNNEGASLVKERDEVGTLVRPRIGSQPSTPTIPSTPTMEPNPLASAPAPATQQHVTLELDDLTAFPIPSMDSFVEIFRLLDQQRVVCKDTLHSIYSSIHHQPLDIDLDQPNADCTNATAVPAVMRKLWPLLISPSTLPPRLTLKIPSDPITITVPVLNPRFSIHLGGRDLKCEPSVLEFGSNRSQRFRITGSIPGRKTLTIQPRLTADNGTPEQYYDLQNLPTKHTIAIERQFMRHTFQISLLNDLGTRRRYLFGTSSAAEKDEWARVLTECLLVAKGQNADRLNEHTGLEQSIGLQILKELLLGVEASDEDEVPGSTNPNGTTDGMTLPIPVTPTTLGLGIPIENGHSPLSAKAGSVRDSHLSIVSNSSGGNGHPSPTLGNGAGAPISPADWPTTAPAHPTVVKDAWMCKMPKPGSAIPDRHGWELVKLVEQNSLMALMLGFMGALGRDRLRRIEAMRRAREDESRDTYEGEDEDEDDDHDEEEYSSDVGLEGEYSEDSVYEDESEDPEQESMVRIPVVPTVVEDQQQQQQQQQQEQQEHHVFAMSVQQAPVDVPSVILTVPTDAPSTEPQYPQIELMLETEEQLVGGQAEDDVQVTPITRTQGPVSGEVPDDFEEGVIGSVSGRVRKVKGNEIWWTR
ncbi:hypothetical protein BGZ83_001561 [Gryganskiella cystojenkinii]|nr:hypothetical protein BGZ83_001561 [Gryganskiella cystojenkinii]